ncbi:MAG: hypothetical protein WBA93_29565 [Microcoleaceae cyanobacterium]
MPEQKNAKLNLVLGDSYSGNVSAMELVEEDLVDVISSDYV